MFQDASPLFSRVKRCARLSLLCLPLVLPAAGADDTTPYRLFVGVDLLVKGDAKDYRRVESLKPDQVIVDEPGLPRMKLNDAGPLSWKYLTKVSRAPITISDFEQHRSYTLRNDKKMQYMSTQNNMVIYQQEKADAARLEASDARFSQEIARSVYVYAENDAASRAGLEGGPAAGYTPGGRGGFDFNDPQGTYGSGEIGANLREANAAAIAAVDDMADQLLDSSSRTSDPTFIDRMQGAEAEGGQDVMELEFMLSSPEPIADAYVVVMGTVKQGEEEGTVTFPHPVGPIGPEPRKVRVRKTGFKPGFTIEEVKLHVYSHGKELATNLSEKSVPLTHQQAREYLLLSHIAQNSLETVAPQPVWALAPPALLAAKNGSRFDYPVAVTIDADGSVLSIHETETEARAFLAQIHDAAELRDKATPRKDADTFADSVRVSDQDADVALDQTGRLPAYVVDAMRDMFFLPALDIGTPVPGTAKVNLADFFH